MKLKSDKRRRRFLPGVKGCARRIGMNGFCAAAWLFALLGVSFLAAGFVFRDTFGWRWGMALGGAASLFAAVFGFLGGLRFAFTVPMSFIAGFTLTGAALFRPKAKAK